MRPWLPVLLVAAVGIPVSATAKTPEVVVHRGMAERFGSFDAFGGFHSRGNHRLPVGNFEGYCCVALPSDSGTMPAIVIIRAPPPPPPPPAVIRAARFTIETTPVGVTIVRGPPILP
jgi:hypothetical protein